MISNGTFVIVDLDSIFDTRLGTIALFDPKTALELIKKPEYVIRMHDDFSGLITHPEWNQEDYDFNYKNRNIATLSYSKITGMVFGLRKMFIEIYSELSNDPEHESMELTINLYPYKLSKEEKEDVFLCLREFMPEVVDIKFTWVPPQRLSPKYLKPRYTHFVTYHFNEWLNLHFGKELSKEELLDNRNPHLKIMAPLLLKDKNQEAEYKKYITETRDQHDVIKNPFLLAMVTFSDTFELIFHPIETYCCVVR